ncbi:winged helix-turn-helix transcriptional regulator [Granulosicoccus sp.]|nr:Lrp/AsnC ligand binding domain-containing protein [Granulosicoccus sp.]MDB4223071.1 winged helix-turn-helix transcriptional regulator [Granulosicoccus sp.]
MLDQFDRSIISILQTEGRITLTELASRVGLTKTPCAARVKRLESDGYILGYKAIVDSEKLGLGHVAFVEVKLTDTKLTALDSFADAARQIAEIEQMHLIAGPFDYLVKVRTSDINAFRLVLGEKLSALPFVSHTSTFVAMSTVVD